MATVRLTDVIVPTVYASYGEVNSPELTAFLSSGIVQMDARLNSYAQGPSSTGTMPYWKDLDQTIEQNYSNDDPADLASPQKISTAQMSYRTSYLNQGWSSMDLVAELLSSDPMRQIRARTSTYWLRRLQRRIIAIARGVLNENLAMNAGDMVIDISLQTTVGVSDANKVSDIAIINAAYTMGDQAGGFAAIGVHSMVMANLVKQNDIEQVRNSDGTLQFQSYKGMRVIVDDSLPVIPGTTSGVRYVTVLFGRGFIGMGVGSPQVPFEVDRVPEAGNGGGQETLWERKTWLLHPLGHNWVEGTLTEFSPTDADLQLAAHWERKFDRKQTPIAFLITNG